MATTALVNIETISAMELFRPGAIDPILDAIKEEVRAQARDLDTSTEANRKAIASLAFKVAKSKTFVENQRKALVADEKKRMAAIDSEGRRIWNEFEALQDEVRQPLTEWENRDKIRTTRHEAGIAEIAILGVVRAGATTADIEQALARVTAIDPATFEEFAKRAAAAQATATSELRTQLILSKQADADRAEMERLRAEAAERAIRDREEAAAKVAAEREKVLAEQRAQAARQAAEAERQRIEAATHEAEARAKQAEAARIAAEERAKRDAELAEKMRIAAEQAAERRAQEAAAQAKRDQEKAIEAERQRVAAAERREREERESRERNTKHRARINREVRDALMQHGYQISEAQATSLVTSLAKNLIPHVAITY